MELRKTTDYGEAAKKLEGLGFELMEDNEGGEYSLLTTKGWRCVALGIFPGDTEHQAWKPIGFQKGFCVGFLTNRDSPSLHSPVLMKINGDYHGHRVAYLIQPEALNKLPGGLPQTEGNHELHQDNRQLRLYETMAAYAV